MIIVKQSKSLLNKVTPDILTGQRSPSPSPSSLEPPSPKSNNVSRRSTVSHHNHHTGSVNGAHSPPNSPSTHKGINYAGGGSGGTYFADHDISPVSSLDPDADLENTDNVKHLKDTLRRGRSGKHHGHNNGHSHAHGHNRQHRGNHKEDRDDAQREEKEAGATSTTSSSTTGAVSREKRTGSSTLYKISPFEWILICIIILLLIIVYKL